MEVKSRDKKTNQVIEEGVQECVDLLLSFASSTKNASKVSTRKTRPQTAKQVPHHRNLLNSTKGDMKKRYSTALKYGTKRRVSGGGSLHEIAYEMNTFLSLRGSGGSPTRCYINTPTPGTLNM